jgi:RNA polymerase sigma-70 factor (ECF subfamily)
VRKYQGKILKYCISMLTNTAEAEDAAQEIFIKAYQSLNQFRGASSFSTWLYRIAYNHCRDILRKISRHHTESWEALAEREGDKLERLLSVPHDSIMALEDCELIIRVLSHLPSDYRTVLVLREIEGLSYQEIAETLNCSLDAVKARLRRARQNFEEKLRHFLGSGDV